VSKGIATGWPKGKLIAKYRLTPDWYVWCRRRALFFAMRRKVACTRHKGKNYSERLRRNQNLSAPRNRRTGGSIMRSAKPSSTPQSRKFLLYKPHSSANFLSNSHPSDVKQPPLQEDRKTERTWRLCYPDEVKRSQVKAKRFFPKVSTHGGFPLQKNIASLAVCERAKFWLLQLEVSQRACCRRYHCRRVKNSISQRMERPVGLIFRWKRCAHGSATSNSPSFCINSRRAPKQGTLCSRAARGAHRTATKLRPAAFRSFTAMATPTSVNCCSCDPLLFTLLR
jgi:hypothetical protein